MSSFLRNFRLPVSVVNAARAQANQGPQGGEKPLHQRVAALEEQVRLMAAILDELTKPKLVTGGPGSVTGDLSKPWAVTFDPPLIVGPGQTLEIGPESCRVVDTYRSSQAEFYASREAKMAEEQFERIRAQNAQDEKDWLASRHARTLNATRDGLTRDELIEQRRRNFPLDPPNSAEPEWDDEL